MVVLAASIVTKSGKALVSRQYVDMSRIRIEGLLAAFPKLVGTNKQHTYVEAENVRYLFQPLEAMYLVLVTNKNSNILEDLETLRLLGKVVPEYVLPLEEEVVQAAAFDLIFAFDEILAVGGLKENVTTAQVRQNTEMESHEEKLHKMIIQSKINETKDAMKKKAQEIDRHKMDAGRPGGRAGMGSVSSAVPSMGGQGGMGGRDSDVQPAFMRPEAASVSEDRGRVGGGKKGMVLGKSGKGKKDFLESLKAEGDVFHEDVPHVPGGASAQPAALPAEPVFLAIDEKLSVALSKDGGLEGMEVQGTMSLTVTKEEDACVRIVLAGGENPGFQFKTHPNIDKALYAGENILGLKDPNRPFPTGAPLGVLKWRYQTSDESLVPLTINCWPSVSGGQSYVNIEYESTSPFDLQHVTIIVPLPALGRAPQVNQIDGDWRYDMRKSAFVWTIELVDDSNKTGSCEFVVPGTDTNIFFPIEVSFSATKTLCDLTVENVTGALSGETVKYGTKTLMSTDAYHVE